MILNRRNAACNVTIAVAFLCSIAAAEQLPTSVVSARECQDAHAKGRWDIKNNPSTRPADARRIQAITLSDVYAWPGIAVELNWQSEHTGRENN